MDRGPTDPPNVTGDTPTLAAVSGRAGVLGGSLERRVQERMASSELAPRLGRFVIVRPLGEGGMGTVYLAYDPQLDRRVALKLLHETMGAESERARKRMRQEAQALAKLNHPNVVTVHDVGVSSGRLYIAMEFVEGHSLRQWCDAKPIGSRARFADTLRRLIDAGRGLVAAHAAGIVHRDVKPDNILVGEDGRVRVADFGLATGELETETDDSESPELDLRTRTGVAVGTPAYMSPEHFDGRAIDPHSDQFGFAVTMFEAIHGIRPFAGNTVLAVREAVFAGRIREVDTPGVPGWIDTILTRALQPNPADRFASIGEMLSAIQRRRRPRWRTWTPAVMGIAGAAAVVAMWPSRTDPCRDGTRQWRAIWPGQARQQAQGRFGSVPYGDASFQSVDTGLREYGEAWTTMHRQACEATWVHGLQSEAALDARMSCLVHRLEAARQAATILATADEAVIDHSVALVHGLDAVSDCGDVEALLAVIPAPEDPQLRTEVERIRREEAIARVLEGAGRYKEALERAEPLVAAAKATEYAPVIAETLLLQGINAQALGQRDTARAVLEQTVWAAVAGRHDRIVADATRLRAAAARADNDLDDANRWLAFAEAASKHVEKEALVVAAIDSERATIAQARGDLPRAEALARRSLEAVSSSPAATPVSIAGRQIDLANILLAMDRFEEAEALGRSSLEIIEDTLGTTHPKTGVVLVNLSTANTKLGRHEEAAQQLERAIAIFEARLGADSYEVAAATANLAHGVARTGDLDRALILQQRSLAVFEKILTANDARLARQRSNVGGTLLQLGRLDEGRQYGIEAVRRLREDWGPDHVLLAAVLVNLSVAQTRSGDPRAGLVNAKDAVRIFEDNGLSDELSDGQIAIADALNAMRRFGPALEAFEAIAADGRTLYETTIGAESLLGLGRHGRAREQLEQALRADETPINPAPRPAKARARFALARATWPDDPQRALDLARQAQREFRAAHPEFPLHIADLDAWLRAREPAAKTAAPTP